MQPQQQQQQPPVVFNVVDGRQRNVGDALEEEARGWHGAARQQLRRKQSERGGGRRECSGLAVYIPRDYRQSG